MQDSYQGTASAAPQRARLSNAPSGGAKAEAHFVVDLYGMAEAIPSESLGKSKERQASNSASIQPESNLHADLNIHRLAIFKRWFKAPLLYRLHRLRVQSEPQSVDHANIARMSFRIDNQPENACSLSLGL